jgi:ATP-dependent helicase/nuclease subunit A
VSSILSNDTELSFPDFTIVSASAGSGKTHALTLRLLQLLLSPFIPNKSLNNILAITFTKNAAGEMKERLLESLKKAHFGDKKTISQLSAVVSLDKELMQYAAGKKVDEILDNYSDLHIQTIDSFLTKIFKSSALEFGLTPQADIILDPQTFIIDAYDLLINELTRSSDGINVLEEFIDQMMDAQKTSSSFIWNPYMKLREEVLNLFTRLMTHAKDLKVIEDQSNELPAIIQSMAKSIKNLSHLTEQSGFESQHWFAKVCESLENKDVEVLIENTYQRSPIKKTGSRFKGSKGSYESWSDKFAPIQQQLSELVKTYVLIKSKMFYKPYTEVYRMIHHNLGLIKRREGKISIGEINKQLSSYIDTENVPEIYFNLGESISHYLIDEFQDTSPIQWETLRPLLENALSKDGSLFIVGDTKQSIFTFRGADWRIMRRLLEQQEFPSAETKKLDLDNNYRSADGILKFNEEVFHRTVPMVTDDGSANASGLSDYKQQADPEKKRKGYVEVLSFENNPSENPEKVKLIEVVKDCHSRGFALKDIAVITPKNSDVVNVSGWLNEYGIEFISHSSLDVRTRKVTGEILSLLKFLDSPIDDLSFATFLVGDIFQAILQKNRNSLSIGDLRNFIADNAQQKKEKHPLYSTFRELHHDLWDKYFSDLYRLAGYLPIYDLVSVMYKTFQVFDLLPYEEATLAKILEVINRHEESGQNSLNDFLSFAEEDDGEGEWNIDIPSDMNAVSVMTIHKAKGLGFQVVIVLLYDSKRHQNNMFIEETGEGIQLYRISMDDAARSEQLNNLYKEQKLREHVDDLNKLYVSLTRAKEEMYILSVKHDRMKEPSCYLPKSGFEASSKPSVFRERHKEELRAGIYHHSKTEIPVLKAADQLKLHERHRGDFIHAVIANIIFLEPDIDSQIRSALQSHSGELSSSIKYESIPRLLADFLSQHEMKEWFIDKPHRRVMNEQEFTTAAGQLFRMDRVVIDDDLVTVIDYKTGDEKEGYREQILVYKNILREIFPNKSVQGALAFIDKKRISWVE